MALLDVDFGSRLDLAGYGDRMVISRDLFVIEPWAPIEYWGDIIGRHAKMLKCNYAIWNYNRLHKRIAVNRPLPRDIIGRIQSEVCHGVCAIKDNCSTGKCMEHVLYPFCESERKPLLENWWKNGTPCIDLNEEVEKRKRGVHPYDRAWVHGC